MKAGSPRNELDSLLKRGLKSLRMFVFTEAERETFLELHNKHETARLAAIERKAAARLKSKK